MLWLVKSLLWDTWQDKRKREKKERKQEERRTLDIKGGLKYVIDSLITMNEFEFDPNLSKMFWEILD